MRLLKHILVENFDYENNPPTKTVKAYKLFRTNKDRSKLYPLYVNRNKEVPMGKWISADEGAKDKNKPTHVASTLGPLAYRPGWHSGDLPVATHIGGISSKKKGAKPDYRPEHHVWAEVEHPAHVDWQKTANERASRTKKGKIVAKTAHITDQVPHNGYYKYKTNSNMTGSWLISGGMKVNRILHDDEVKSINDKHGVADLPRLHNLKK